MPLIMGRAGTLLAEIKRNDIVSTTADNKYQWDQYTSRIPIVLDSENIDKQLVSYRKKILDRKSTEIGVPFEGQTKATLVRVYPHKEANIESDIHDVFGRGLDAARAVNEILDNDPIDRDPLSRLKEKPEKDEKKEKLIELINRFQINMQTHANTPDTQKGHANALKELKRFNGALANLLVDENLANDTEHASHAINFVRDFLWKRDIANIPHCVVERNPSDKDNPITMLRYAEPITYENPIRYKSKGKIIDLWEPHQTQDWFKKLAKKVGAPLHRSSKNSSGESEKGQKKSWLEKFFDKHKDDLKKQSSTPMSRYTPNPANAFDCTDIQVKDDQVTQLSHHSRVAVTEPISVGGTGSRQRMTDWNHMQLLNQTKLASELNSFMEHWGDIYKDGEAIPLTMLHQTLIGDEVTFSPDQSKAKRGWQSLFQGSVIDSKVEANKAVRATLNKYHILWDQKSNNIRFVAKSKTPDPQDAKKPNERLVDVELLETNNCINMWADRSRVRNRDINDSRTMINKSVQLFEKVREQLPDTDPKTATDLKTVTDFLKSRDHSVFTPYKYRGKDVKEAIGRLTHELSKNENTFSGQFKSQDARDNFALSLQSAVELKCTVHETWAGSARRTIANFTRDYLRTPYLLGIGHLVDGVVRGAMSVAAFLGRGVSKLLSPAQTAKHSGERKQVYKAAYEGLLAESLGSLQGGCMSSADRAGEMAEQRAAMKRQFAAEGKIIGYNDPKTEKDAFYQTYGSTRAKHAFVEMATGTQATSDTETRGFYNRDNILSHVAESPEERQLASDISGLRKGKYDGKITHDDYKEKPPVGTTSPKQKHTSDNLSAQPSFRTLHEASRTDEKAPLLSEDNADSGPKANSPRTF